MKESVVFLTKNSNSYLYSAQSLLSLLIHPELRKAYDKSANVDPYYLKKYEYLEKYGLFKEAENTDFETSFDESIIKKNISQVRQIVFETTDHCNLHCSYCSLGELYKIGKTNHKNINTDFAINFLKYIFNIKPSKS
ncbi:radical SAM peptide maturase, partial [Escherichia coli]|nr:radical SAM peptide maturase [Escherichia coli]